MRFSLLVAALAAPSALAFPWMTPEGLDAMMNHPEARKEIQRRLEQYEAEQAGHIVARDPQLGTGLIPGIIDLIGGTLKAVLDPILGLIPTSDNVKGLKKFPERMYGPLFTMIWLTDVQLIIHSRPLARLISVDHAQA